MATNLTLASDTYSPEAANFFLAYARYRGRRTGNHYDGDLQNARFTGLASVEHPFAKFGDRNSAIVRPRVIQDAAYFTATPLGTLHPNDPRLLLIDEVDFEDQGGRVIKWTRVYASLPPSNDRFGSMNYGFQYLPVAETSLTVAEQPFEVSCRIRTEYFLVSQRAQFPPLIAPRAIALTSRLITKRGQGNLYLDGSFVLSTDPEIIAEDSKVDYWNYPIMYRRTPWIQGPTAEFWGKDVVLPVGVI